MDIEYSSRINKNNYKMENNMVNQQVQTIGPNMGVRTYNSLSSASRVLSGWGDDGKRNTIARRCDEGGGFVGRVWVQYK